MIFRTDLALETQEILGNTPQGVHSRFEKNGDATITRTIIETEIGERAMGRPIGNYVTLEFSPISDSPFIVDENVDILSKEISSLIPKDGLVLIIGLGNTDITPDALGPKTASMVLATRHIQKELARVSGLDKLRPSAVLAPGVLGQTGIESAELVISLVSKLKPSTVIVVDALASRSLARLGCTIQLSDTGISPGAGVGNKRPKINSETLGIPVIAIGVPTVVDAATLAADLLSPSEEDYDEIRDYVAPRGAEMMITPREIDLLIERASRLIAMSINCALHPSYSVDELFSLVS